MDTLLFQLNDFAIHKQFVLESGNVLAKHLYQQGKEKEAIALLKRISVHDNSKLYTKELTALSQIPYNLSGFTNANSELTNKEKELIKLHWQHNSHHPEHYKNYNEMSELDIMEMVCDWHARSRQYKTDFIGFVKIRQKNRFMFPKAMFEKILEYCLIVENESK